MKAIERDINITGLVHQFHPFFIILSACVYILNDIPTGLYEPRRLQYILYIISACNSM